MSKRRFALYFLSTRNLSPFVSVESIDEVYELERDLGMSIFSVKKSEEEELELA